MTQKSTDNVSMKNSMTNSELYYYRHWRNSGLAIALCLVLAIVAAVFLMIACMYQSPKIAIALGCVAAFFLFVAKIKCTDAARYYQRAFPRGDSDGFKL